MKKLESNYEISKKEINRRIVAYTTLIVSFFISLILFSFNYIAPYLNIFIYVIIILAGLLFCSRIIVLRYFKSLSKGIVSITSEYIIKNETKYLIKNIEKIVIKRTTKGYIREMKIAFHDKSDTFINNSIDNTEGFLKELQKYLPKNAVEKTIYEPIDFDHPTFYFFLGILISFISVESLKIFITLGTEKIKIIYYMFSLLAASLGIYFIIYKPTYKRDEKANHKGDYIWGIIFIIGSILILLSILF